MAWRKGRSDGRSDTYELFERALFSLDWTRLRWCLVDAHLLVLVDMSEFETDLDVSHPFEFV